MTYFAPMDIDMLWQMQTEHAKDVIYLLDRNGHNKTNEQLLNSRVPPLTKLEREYPLPGIDAFSPGTANLGTMLGALPLEIQHAILVKLDLTSFLDFRKVNKRAMAAADSVVEYKKIIKHDSTKNVVRMALALKSGYRFTVAQLFDKLCKTTCDTCENIAAYIDVFKCSRQCLNVGGNCKPRNLYKLDQKQFAQLALTADNFCTAFHSHHYFAEDGEPTRIRYYDGEAAAKLSPSVAVQNVPNQRNLRLTAVRALHLHRNDHSASHVVLCDKCIDKSSAKIQRFDRLIIISALPRMEADLADVTLGFDSDIKTHQAVAHSEPIVETQW